MQSSAIFILNRQEKVINILNNVDSPNRNPFFDDILTQTLSTGADTYKFTTTFNQKNSRSITVGNKVAFMLDGKYMLFQIVSVNDIHGDNLEMEVYCESAGLSLINSVCRGQKIVSCDVKKFLEAILQDTEWNVGFVDMSLSNTFDLDLETASVYSLLQNNIKKYDAEIRFRCEMVNGRISKKFIDVFRIRGRVSGKRFEFGKNVESISREIDSSELFTALIGEGKNGLNFSDISLEDVPNKPQGQDFVFDQEAYNRYNQNGYHLMGVFKYETESKEELLRETYKKLQECKNPKIKYTVNVSLLGKDVEVGETVNIIDRFFEPPLLLQARVSKLEKSLTDNSNVRCELSNFVEVSSNINIELLNKVKDFVDNSITDRFPIGTNDIQDGAVTGQKIYENSITTDHLIAGVVTADKIHAESIKANHIAANQVKAQHIEAGAIDATKIQAESIESEHIVANAIKSEHIITGSVTTDKIEAGSITAEKIQTGAITAGSGIIAEGAIGSAQISSLEANKINTGTLDTSLVNIAGPDGNMEITGNQLLVNNKGKNRVIVGEYRTDEDETKYGLLVRGEDDTTIMIDEKGVHNAGITDGAIDNNKVSQSANIDGTKLNINSVIREVNENGTESIKGTKVVVGDRSLEVELKEQQNTITEHGQELSTQKSQIVAMDDKINLKVDSQTFTEATQTINQSIETSKQQAISTSAQDATNKANNAKNEAINSASQDATNKANQAQENAKAYTNAEITTVNQNLNKATSEISILQDEIKTKVSQTEIDKSIANIKFSDVNMIMNSGDFENTKHWSITNGEDNLIIEDKCLIAKFKNYSDWGVYVSNDSLRNKILDVDKDYTVVCKLKASKGTWVSFQICDGGSQNMAYSKSIELTTEWQIFKFTFRPSQVGNERQFRFISGRKEYEFDLHIEFVKMVEGKTSSDVWSPAPEDVNQIVVDNIDVVSERISSVESKLTQDLDGIKLNVSGLDSKTTQLETNITTVNRDLTGKINSGVQSAKDYATSQANSAKQQAISTSSQDATNKANQAQQNAINSSKEYTNVQISSTNSKVSEVQSSLNVLKEKVETKVSQSDVDKSISNIVIGGRNLILKSDVELEGTRPISLNVGGLSDVQSIVGKKAIVSLDIDCEELTVAGQSNRLGYELAVGFEDDTTQYIGCWYYVDSSPASFKGRISSTHTIKNKKIISIHYSGLYIQCNGKRIKIGRPKMELGTKATDWSPAPEDTDSKIQDGIRITDEKINKVSSTVTQLKDSVTTEISSLKSKTQTIESNLDGKASKSEVQELNTQVAQQKVSLDGITNRVGQTETKTSQLEGSIDEVNRDLTGKINSGVQSAKDYATSQANNAKQQAISTSSQDATNKANQAQENAKAYTNGQISSVSNKVNSVESSLNILKDKVETKVSKEEVQESIANIKFSDVNMILNSGNFENTNHWGITNGSQNLSITNNVLVAKFNNYANWGLYVTNDSLRSKPLDVTKDYTVVCKLKASRNQTVGFSICDGNSSNSVYGKDLDLTTNWKIFKFTFKPKQVGNERQFRFITGNLGYEFDLYIEFVKMVEGKTSSDVWSPAPEDTNQIVVDKVQVVDSKISSVSSSVTQLRDSVNTQISSLNSKTQSLETSLDGKATKQEVQQVDSKVTTINADLQGITQRVSNTERLTSTLNGSVQDLSSRISTAEQKITPTAIINTVSSTIDNKINSINIGGRNLLLNTLFEGDKSPWSASGFTLFEKYEGLSSENYFYKGCIIKNIGIDTQAILRQNINIKTGVQHTLSFYEFTDKIRRYWVGVYYDLDGEKYITLRDGEKYHSGWTKRVYKFTIPDGATNISLRFYHYGVDSNDERGTIWLANMKLEEGNYDTQWTPAPEDTSRELKEMSSKFNITIDGISSEVSKKVNSDKVVSTINQSAEGIKIDANRIDLRGYVTATDLAGKGTTVIDGSNIRTGEIHGVAINSCYFEGKNMMYIREGGTFSCDGPVYAKDFYVPTNGSFSVEPDAWFSKNVHATGKIYQEGKGVLRKEDAWIQVRGFGVENSGDTTFLKVYTDSSHVYGVDLWYSDARYKQDINPVENSKKGIGLDLIKEIEHYSYTTLDTNSNVHCGYLAQNLPKEWVYNVEQEDGSEFLQVDSSKIIPNLSLAIQQQQEIIDNLKARIEELENKN